MLHNECQPKMFCLITPQIKEEFICFLLYLKSLWNVLLDFQIKLKFWFRNGWLACKTKIKVDTYEIPFFIFYVYFILSIYSSGEEQIKEISNSNIKSHVDPRCNSGAGEQAAPGWQGSRREGPLGRVAKQPWSDQPEKHSAHHPSHS